MATYVKWKQVKGMKKQRKIPKTQFEEMNETQNDRRPDPADQLNITRQTKNQQIWRIRTIAIKL